MKESSLYLITFLIEGNRFAFPLQDVEKVIQAVAFREIPDTSDWIDGVIDFHGVIVPLLNLRKRFRMPERSLAVHDQIIIVNSDQRKMAVSVDKVGAVQTVNKADLVAISLEKAGHSNKKHKSDLTHDTVLLRDNDGVVIIYQLHQLVNTDVMVELDRIFLKEN